MGRMTVAELEKIKTEHAGRMAFRDKTYLLLCGGTGCHATGSLKLIPALKAEIEAKGLQEKVVVVETGCNGFCALGPIMVVQPGGYFYEKLSVDDVPEIVESHLINGKPVEKNQYKDPQT